MPLARGGQGRAVGSPHSSRRGVHACTCAQAKPAGGCGFRQHRGTRRPCSHPPEASRCCAKAQHWSFWVPQTLARDSRGEVVVSVVE